MVRKSGKPAFPKKIMLKKKIKPEPADGPEDCDMERRLLRYSDGDAAQEARLVTLVLEQRVDIDIDLARRTHVQNSKTVGLGAVLHHSDFLGADHLLPRIRKDDSGRGRPDVPGGGIGKGTPLM